MTGKYRWTREIPPAPEWFDFDREDKTMETDPTPDIDILSDQDPEPSGWLDCPQCGSTDMEYAGELYDDEEHVGSYYECRECGHRFSDSDEEY